MKESVKLLGMKDLQKELLCVVLREELGVGCHIATTIHGSREDGRATGRDVVVSHYVEASYPSLDPIETQWAVIAAGLSEGDRVIASNSDQIEHGTLVQIAGRPVQAQTSGDAP